MNGETTAKLPIEIDSAVEQIKHELERFHDGTTGRVDCTPENVEQALAKLVLTLVEFLRKLLERQAIRRMEGGTLDDTKIEEMGLALMRLEQKVAEIAAQFGLKPEDLNLELGPLGDLMPKR
jgi:Gas vesicle protein K